jgi:hypothetical protein
LSPITPEKKNMHPARASLHTLCENLERLRWFFARAQGEFITSGISSTTGTFGTAGTDRSPGWNGAKRLSDWNVWNGLILVVTGALAVKRLERLERSGAVERLELAFVFGEAFKRRLF